MCRSPLRQSVRQSSSTSIPSQRLCGLPAMALAVGGLLLFCAAGQAGEADTPEAARSENRPLLRAPGPVDEGTPEGTEIQQKSSAEPQRTEAKSADTEQSELGEATSIPPAGLEGGLPPAPAPARGSVPDAPLPGSGFEGPAGQPAPQESADAVLQRVQLEFDRGNWNTVIRETSGLLAINPDDEQARQMRGRAYAATGRFEEALADINPVPAVTTRPSTNVMSGRTVLATLERGTPLEISEVRGDWLLVSRTGIRADRPGWVHRDLLAPREILTAPDVAGRVPAEPLPLLEPLPEPSGGGLQFDLEIPGSATIWRGRHPSRSFFELHLDIGGRSPRYDSHRYGPHRSGYGREDDWRRFVPREFRQFLPR